VRELKLKVATLDKKLDKILELLLRQRQHHGTMEEEIDEFEMPYLPCASVEAIDALNSDLKDEQFAKFLVRWCSVASFCFDS
jgi:hypothetical protein